MICCVDVDYQATGVTTACVGFGAWTDEVATIELVVRSAGAAPPYEPGAFYRRELPYVLGALERMPALDVIVVDAYVWLAPDEPGLGWHLHDARGIAVIGVAKTRYAGAAAASRHRAAGPLSGIGAAAASRHRAAGPLSGIGAESIEVVRGDSARPLFVTAVGIDAGVAADHIRAMHGEFRIPTLIRCADGLARGR
jgi:deoxyribonuclease V